MIEGEYLNSDSDNDTSRAEDGEAEAEARMRHALGLMTRPRHGAHESPPERRVQQAHGSAGTRRHRFVQDGEVPVSVVRAGGRREGPSLGAGVMHRAGESPRADELAAERNAREQAERRLAEAQLLVRSLQTRLADADMARDELETELRAARASLEAARGVPIQPAATSAISVDVAGSASLRDEEDVSGEMSDSDSPSDMPRRRAVRKRGQDPAPPGLEDEPEPVKWWT